MTQPFEEAVRFRSFVMSFPDAAAALALLGGGGPSDHPSDQRLYMASGAPVKHVHAADLRKLARGLDQLATWLEMRDRMRGIDNAG